MTATYISVLKLRGPALTTVLTASTTAAGTSVDNLRTPNLGKPWRSTVTTTGVVLIDWGAPTLVDRIALIGPNFSSVKIQENATDSWGAPTFDSGFLTIARDPDRRLYRRWYGKPSGQFTLRYTRVLIPAQTPVDGAPYFSLAALWGGLFVALPNDPMASHGRGVATPKVTGEADLGEWRVAYRSGQSFARQHYIRQAEMIPITPGVGDEYGAWMDLDRQIADAGTFCFIDESVGEGGRSGVWIMQQENKTTGTWSGLLPGTTGT